MDIVERLNDIPRRIGDMCATSRPPRMSIPAQDDDDDMFILAACREAATEITSLRERVGELTGALEAILAEPYGCRFCDGSGKLLNPIKEHDDDCGFALARRALGKD